MDTYSQILIVIVIILFATIFLGLLILGNPKYEIIEKPSEKMSIAESLIGAKYKLDAGIINILKIGFYNAIILSVLYLLMIILMLRIIFS